MTKPNLAEPFNSIYDSLSSEMQDAMVTELLSIKRIPQGIALVPAIQKTMIQNMQLDEIEEKYRKLMT